MEAPDWLLKRIKVGGVLPRCQVRGREGEVDVSHLLFVSRPLTWAFFFGIDLLRPFFAPLFLNYPIVSFFVTVNDSSSRFFLEHQGVEIGESLFPYLVIVIEAPGSLLKRFNVGGFLLRCRVRGREWEVDVSHLLFVSRPLTWAFFG